MARAGRNDGGTGRSERREAGGQGHRHSAGWGPSTVEPKLVARCAGALGLAWALVLGVAGAGAAGPAEVPILLSGAMQARWRIVDPAVASAGKAGEGATVKQVRLELALGPKGVPRSRFVGSAVLRAERDGTWIEFNANRAAQVLKLRVNCEGAPDGQDVALAVTPYIQLVPTARPVRFTELGAWRMEQSAELLAQRAEQQLVLLGVGPPRLALEPGGDGKAGGARHGGAAPPRTPAGERAKAYSEYQLKTADEARRRLAELANLRGKLDGVARLEVRALHAADGRTLDLVPTPLAGDAAGGPAGAAAGDADPNGPAGGRR